MSPLPVAMAMNLPLFAPTDTWPLLALMVIGTAASIWLEQRYQWGARLSAPVIALLIAMALSNTRVVPMEAPVYDFAGTWLVPLALPLLLFRANVFHIARSTGRMLVSFHIASLGTLIGAVLAFYLVGRHVPEALNATGIMAASYIGGMVNFVAVAESTRASGTMTSTLLVADNLVMAALFIALLGIAASRFFLKQFPSALSGVPGSGAPVSPAASAGIGAPVRKDVTVLDIALSLAVAAGVAGAAMTLKQWIDPHCALVASDGAAVIMLKTLASNRFVLITTLALVVSTVFARQMARVSGPEQIGGFLLYLFLFTVGLPADLFTVLTKSPVLFLFCGIMAFTNLAFTLLVGRMLKLPLEELLLSVNASVGGPPTAAAMAVSKGWTPLVLPALLAGLWGYVIGTPLGLIVISLLK